MARDFAFFFLGGDTAPSENRKSDEGSLMVGCAQPRVLPVAKEKRGRRDDDDEAPVLALSNNPADWYFDFMFCRVFNSKEKLSARQWSGNIHNYHQRFGFQKIVLDGGSGGGGIFVARELMEKKQIINGVEKDVTPLCDQVNAPQRVVRGEFIVHIFKRGDPGIELVWPNSENSAKSLAGDELLKDALHADFKDRLDQWGFGWPPLEKDLREEEPEAMRKWSEERQWALKNLNACTTQLKGINVATKEDGTHFYTARGARHFISSGRDDIAMSAMYCYAAFLIWLKSDAFRGGQAPEDEDGFSG